MTSASYSFRSTGSTISITVSSAVFQNTLKSGLGSRFGDQKNTEELISWLRDSLDETWKLPVDWRLGALDAYMAFLQAVFVILLGLIVLEALVGIASRGHKLQTNLLDVKIS